MDIKEEVRVKIAELLGMSTERVTDDAALTDPQAGHLPLSLETFLNDADGLVGDSGQPADTFEEGYGIWREAFDEGDAGVW